jgi:PAS domain S-box-containing protein
MASDYSTTGQGPQRGYRAALWLAAVLAPLLVVLVSGLLFYTLISGAHLRAEVERSFRTREQIQRVFSLMQDAETGQRGFIVTGREDFLEPYHSGTAALDLQLQALDDLLGDSETQQRHMAELRRQVVVKLGLLANGIELRRRTASEADAFVSTGAGKAAMDQIRGTVGQMIASESERLERRVAAADRLTLLAQWAAGAMVFLLLAILGVAALLVHRHTRSRQALLERIGHERARQVAIFENTLDAVVTLNASGSIETLNRAAEAMFGYGRQELVRRDAATLINLAPGEGLFVVRLALGEEQGAGAVREHVGRRKDGSTFPAEVALAVMKAKDGLRVVAAIRDISDRKQVERLKDEFVSTVSHELRTPLTSIAGSLSLLDAGAAGPLPEKASRLVHIAKASSDRLVRLINDLLDVQKIASGQVRFEMARLDLAVAVSRAVEGMGGLAQERGVRIAYEAPPQPVLVNGDSERLIQVVNNLVSNAIKFSPADGAVELVLRTDEKEAVLTVRDHGPGVPEAFKQRLFQRFAQADGSSVRSVGGSGLGLAISREIAERHRGAVRLAGSDSTGSVFELRIPLADVAAQSSATRRLLICESDPDLAQAIAGGLQKDGYIVDVTPSAEAAEAALAATAYDALLLDISGEGGSALELARRIRSEPGPRGLPLLVMSGQEGGEIAGVAVTDWITKPVDLKRLRRAVQATVGGRADLTILHVDDDADLAEVVRESLASAGRVHSVGTLAAARRYLSTQTADVVILDVGLPDGSGLELLPLIAADGAPPVIIYSGQEVDPAQARKVQAVLTKSRVNFEVLSRTVSELTRREEPAA